MSHATRTALALLTAVCLAACDDFDAEAQAARCRADAALCLDAGAGGGGGGGLGGGAGGGGGGFGDDGGSDGGSPDAGAPDSGADGGASDAGSPGTPTLPDGLFSPETVTLRATSTDRIFGRGVAVTPQGTAWVWAPESSVSTSNLELFPPDGGSTVAVVPFLVTGVAALGDLVMTTGINAANQAALHTFPGGTRVADGWFGTNIKMRAAALRPAPTGPLAVLVGEAANGTIRAWAFDAGSMSLSTATASAVLCGGTGGDVRQLVPSADGGLLFAAITGPLCPAADGGTAVYRFDPFTLAAPSLLRLGPGGLVAPGASNVLWAAETRQGGVDLLRFNSTTLQPIDAPYRVEGNANVSGLVASASNVFLVLSTAGSALSSDAGELAPQFTSQVLILQFDPQGVLQRFGRLDAQSAGTSPDGVVLDGRDLLVSGTCQSDAGFCAGPSGQAYLLRVSP